MKYRITILPICIFFLLSYTVYSNGNRESTQPQEESNAVIHWEFQCKDITGAKKVLPYNEIFEITPECRYRVYFKTGKALFVYVFLYTTDENITLLFPEDVRFFGVILKPGIIYSIPEPEDQWLSPEENTRIKNLYFLAVPGREKRLERFTRQFLALSNTAKPAPGKVETIKNKLIEEIIRVNRRNNRYVLYAEKPNTYSGNVQNDENQKEMEWFPEENSDE